jgi:hypothetical protein
VALTLFRFVTLHTVLDHGMYRAWRRDAVRGAILDHLGDGGGPPRLRLATTAASA